MIHLIPLPSSPKSEGGSTKIYNDLKSLPPGGGI